MKVVDLEYFFFFVAQIFWGLFQGIKTGKESRTKTEESRTRNNKTRNTSQQLVK